MDENQCPSIAFFCYNTSFNLTFLGITSFDLNINHTAFSCQKKSNITSLSELWNDPVIVILRVEVLVIIAAALLVILVLFGSHRRRSGSSFLSLILFMAYTIPNLLVPYTIGLMGSANFRNSLFVVWTMFLILSLGRACSISAYTLDDNEHWKRRKMVQVVQLFWACWLLVTYAQNWKVASPLAIILVLSGLRMADTCEAFRLATLSYGVASNTKLVADFMHEENGVGGGEFDPVTMRGYNYLVAGEEEEKVDEASPPEYLMKLTITARVITVDKIWSLTSVEDPGVIMKDTCLSFALYKLLRRRFAGYRLVEAGHPKTLAFVMRGLLSGDEEGERTFRVIEVELAFLYDSFYTTYPVIFSRWFKMLAKSCLLLLVSLWVITLPIYYLDEIDGEYHTIFDVKVTYALVSSMMGLELCQIIVFVLSDWAKVLAICKFVEKPSLHGNLFYQMIFRFLCRPRRILSRWNGKLGQYSLVDSYNYCPCKLLLCMQGLFLMDKTRKGQKAGPQIKLPKEVKKAIVSSLGATGGKLSNGLSSLSRNEVSDSLSWACKFETLTHTHTILVWHIATSMCQNARERRQTPTEASDDKSNVIVASSLSRYCAYLVAFVPELLPDHKFVTSCIFGNVIKEASRDLAGYKKREEKYDKLTQEGVPEETVMGRGEKLGRQLLQLQEELRWRVLADFWSEMMLYLAPSDNAKAHAERLAKGGEFITHLWALLSHAGVLQRDDASPA